LLFEELVQRGGALQRAVFATAMPLVGLSMRLTFGPTFTLDVGGKTPRFLR
jgi:hypothetical protein